MIFKTTDDGGLTNIFKELKSVQVTFEELDKTTLRSAIKSFNNTSISVEDLSKRFGGLDNSVVEYLNNTERGQASMDGLSKSIDNSAISMISATAKAKILAIALNALTGLAISLAFKGITWAIDELIVTLDEQKEKLDEAVTAYEESKSELEKINDELKTTSERIDELNGKENLTFTEQDELEKLIKTNDELERKIYLLEQANKEAEKEVVTEAQNTYDKYTNNRTLGAVEQIEFYSDSSLLEGVNWDNFKGDLSWLVAQYKNQEEILANAQANGWTNIEERAKSNLELLEGYMSEASLDYQDLYDKIGGISDFAMTEDLELAKQDLDDILDIVAEILGYGGQRSETSFDDIWNSEDFSQYKTELETLAKEGKLDASVLESNEQYKKLLEDTGATAESTAEHIKALVAETEQAETQNPDKITVFKSFDDTNLGERLQHANKLFKEGELTHKQYFDSLQNEIDNFDASNFTDSLEDANKASQQFFTDSVQQSASGLSDLINKFDAGEMSVSEYLDGYLAIGETLSTLADNLQENSSAWDKNGEAMSDAVSSGLDSVQSDLDNAMSIITGYKDSIYSLEQIMTGAVKAGSDEFTAHTNVIAQDLANIVASGGEMASEVANTLGTTTSEIASNLTKNVSNQSLAAQAIASNTNIAISNMATSVANIFTTLGNAISNFNVDISFSKTSGSLIDAITGNGELKFNLSASGETLSTIGDAISAFGETLALNIQPQLIEAPDFSLDVDEYTPDVDTLKNYNDELDRLKDSSKGASKSTDALTESMKKQKEALEKQKEALEEQKQYYEDVSEAVNWFYDKQIEKQEKFIDGLEKENELLEERLNDYDGALSAIDRYYEKQIEGLEKQKDALEGNNKEAEIAIELEKRQQELREARNRKSVNLYEKGKGFVYTTDSSAIRDAEENLADAQRQKEEYDIDAQIEKLKEYQKLWSEIPSVKEKAEEDSQMIALLGAEWESILLEGRIQNISSFKDQYIGLQQQIDNNEGLIASYEEKITYYESLKEQWDALTSRYEEDTYRQLLIGEFGNDYEDILLNGRTERWEQFADDYYNIQVELKDVTDQIEALAKRMEEYASKIESAANNAVNAITTLANTPIPNVPSGNNTVLQGGGINVAARYAKGTRNAKKGIAEVAEEGAEIITNGKTAVIATEPTLVNMGGGETVYTANETEKILSSDGLEPFAPQSIDKNQKNGEELDLTSFVNKDGVIQQFTPTDIYSMLENYRNLFVSDAITMSRFNIPNQDFSKFGIVNNAQKSTVVEFKGDIVLQGVQDVEGFAKAIKYKFPMLMERELGKRF